MKQRFGVVQPSDPVLPGYAVVTLDGKDTTALVSNGVTLVPGDTAAVIQQGRALVAPAPTSAGCSFDFDLLVYAPDINRTWIEFTLAGCYFGPDEYGNTRILGNAAEVRYQPDYISDSYGDSLVLYVDAEYVNPYTGTAGRTSLGHVTIRAGLSAIYNRSPFALSVSPNAIPVGSDVCRVILTIDWEATGTYEKLHGYCGENPFPVPIYRGEDESYESPVTTYTHPDYPSTTFTFHQPSVGTDEWGWYRILSGGRAEASGPAPAGKAVQWSAVAHAVHVDGTEYIGHAAVGYPSATYARSGSFKGSFGASWVTPVFDPAVSDWSPFPLTSYVPSGIPVRWAMRIGADPWFYVP